MNQNRFLNGINNIGWLQLILKLYNFEITIELKCKHENFKCKLN